MSVRMPSVGVWCLWLCALVAGCGAATNAGGGATGYGVGMLTEWVVNGAATEK